MRNRKLAKRSEVYRTTRLGLSTLSLTPPLTLISRRGVLRRRIACLERSACMEDATLEGHRMFFPWRILFLMQQWPSEKDRYVRLIEHSQVLVPVPIGSKTRLKRPLTLCTSALCKFIDWRYILRNLQCNNAERDHMFMWDRDSRPFSTSGYRMAAIYSSMTARTNGNFRAE